MARKDPELFSGALGQRFEHVRHIGRGGMAEVFLVRDRFRQHEVALKIVFPQQGKGDQRQQLEHLWMNEMRIAGRLKHPNILEIYEAGTEGDTSFLVMEYLSGGALSTYATGDTLLAPAKVADITFKICHALEYAHTQGLLHRDVKPANVLLAADGTPKISDFGAAYLLDEEHTQVIGVGTLAFMPPEHFEGAEPGVRLDIYATGVMAYNLLTGAFPHKSTTQADIINEKLHGKPVPGSATITESARFEVLRKIRFFERFSDTEVWEAVRIGTAKSFDAGMEVIAEGTDDTTVYVVESGDLEVARSGVRLGRVPTGEVFGEIAFIEGSERPRSASVRAISPTTVICFPADVLKQATGGLQAAFGRAIVRLLVQRLVHSNERYVAAIKAKAPPAVK